MEIERQWLFDIDKVPEQFRFGCKDMEQSYLNLEPEVRLRKETSKPIFELRKETYTIYWITINYPMLACFILLYSSSCAAAFSAAACA